MSRHPLFSRRETVHDEQMRLNAQEAKPLQQRNDYYCSRCDKAFSTSNARFEHQKKAGHLPKHPGGYDPNKGQS